MNEGDGIGTESTDYNDIMEAGGIELLTCKVKIYLEQCVELLKRIRRRDEDNERELKSQLAQKLNIVSELIIEKVDSTEALYVVIVIFVILSLVLFTSHLYSMYMI